MSSTDPQVLDAIVKAYDVRGTVPDQFNAGGRPRARRRRSPASPARPRVLVGRDMRPSGPELVDGVRHGRASSRASTSSTSAWCRPTWCTSPPARSTLPARCSPPRTTRRSTTASSCASPAPARSASTPGWTRSRRSPPQVLDGHGPRRRAARRHGAAARNLLDAFADHVAVVRRRRRRCARCASSPTRPTAWAASSCRRSSSGSRRSTLEVMYGELDGTFPNHPADPLQPANQRDLQARVVSGGFDVGLAFDGDADRVFVVDETGRGLSGSTTTALLAAAMLRTHPGRHDPAQPDLLAGRARGDPRARRRAGAHQGRALVHQAGDGRDRRGVRRRALGALLLRRQLPRRQRPDRHDARARRAQPRRAPTCRWCASRSSATRRAARSTPTSTTRRR